MRRAPLPALLVVLSALLLLALPRPGAGAGYPALQGLERLDTVFDVSLGNPKKANAVFWAVRNVHQDESVRALPRPPRTVVVFHGPAVRLLTTDRSGMSPEEAAQAETFAETLRAMKREGVTLEVCLYAAKVLGVNPDTILPEVDRVGNGFISVTGYQAQGYAVVTVP